jgi:hypothetical protein
MRFLPRETACQERAAWAARGMVQIRVTLFCCTGSA